MKILNLTQHTATAEQIEAGVFEPARKEEVKTLLTFVGMPSKDLLVERALKLSTIATEEGAEYAMIGGAPYFMSPLEKQLKAVGVTALYAYSERQSIEEQTPDGVVKRSIFKHVGFVPAV